MRLRLSGLAGSLLLALAFGAAFGVPGTENLEFFGPPLSRLLEAVQPWLRHGTVRTKCRNTRTGGNILRTLWPMQSEQWLNRRSFCQNGSAGAIGCNWCYSADVIDAGMKPRPLSFCTRDGLYYGILIDFKCSRKLAALIPTGSPVSEVLGCCFMLLCIVLCSWSLVVYLVGKTVIQQVHGQGRLSYSTSLCPRSVCMSSCLRRCRLRILHFLHPATQCDNACTRAQAQCHCEGFQERDLDMATGPPLAPRTRRAPTTPNGTPLPTGPPPPRSVNEDPAVSALREASEQGCGGVEWREPL